MSDPNARLDALERQVRRLRWLSFAGLALSLVLAGFLARAQLRPAPVRELVLGGAGGTRTVLRAGEIRLEAEGGNRLALRVDGEASTLSLATHERSAVAPELTLRVADRGTPASVLLSDRKARNFAHLYVNGGRAGLEIAGIREYRNLDVP